MSRRQAFFLAAAFAVPASGAEAGVSAYKLTKTLPEKIKGTVPAIKDIEAELKPDQ